MAQTAFNPNMIIRDSSDEGISSQTESTSAKSILASQANSNQQNPINIFFYLLHSNALSDITSWQVKVQLIEIKNLFGNNKNVYCTVKIGDQMFRSSTKSVDKMRFNEVYLFEESFYIEFLMKISKCLFL